MWINGRRMRPVIQLTEFLWTVGNFKYLRERNFKLDTTSTHSLLHHPSLICLILLGFIISSNYFPLGAQDCNLLILFFKKEGISSWKNKKRSSWEVFWLPCLGLYLCFRTSPFPRVMKYLLWLTKTGLCSHPYGPGWSEVL